MDNLDVVVIAGDFPQEFLGKDVREKTRLTVDGVPASLDFLGELFRFGGDRERAVAAMTAAGPAFVSLNGPYLCQFLEARNLHCCLIPLLSFYQQELVAALRRQPRAVVISTTFLPFAKHIDAIAARIKQLAPSVTVIAGGVQVWKAYRHLQLLEQGQMEESIREAVAEHNYFLDASRPSPVDYFVVSPSGEDTLAAMISALPDASRVRAMHNVAYFQDGRWQINALREEACHDITVDWRRFADRPARAYLPVQAGLGCYFRCAFCDFAGLRSVHERDVSGLVAEISSMPPAADGVRRVYFTDDNLFSSKARAKQILTAMLESRMDIRWRGLVRIDVIDDELAELMARSGCLEVLLGIESGDGEMLKRMSKRVTPEHILGGIETLTRYGIHTKSTFLVGFPGETDTSVRHTVDLLNAYPTSGESLHRYLFFTFAVLPLSPVASAASRKRYGLKGYGYHWRHDTMDSVQASAHMLAVHEQIRDELSPSYILDVPETRGLSVADLGRVYVLRNELARMQRQGCSDVRGVEQWASLERLFQGARR